MDIEIPIDEKLGSISGSFLVTESCTHVLLLAHGAGAGMNHPFMLELADTLLLHDIGTLRFNFPYMEKGKRRPDNKQVTTKSFSCVMARALELTNLPLVAAGKSFGGRMASHWVHRNPTVPIAALVFYGFPLHAIGKPGVERAEHLKEVEIPMLFLQGTRDGLAKLDLLEPLLHQIPQTELVILEGADHGFRFLKKTGIDHSMMLEILASKTRHFLNEK